MGRPAILKIDILADAKGVLSGVADADSALGRLGRGAAAAGAAVGVGLLAGGAALAAFGASSVAAASEVEQSMGAVESVFGKAADQVKGYAEGAASNLGLAKSEYASLAAVVGSQLQSMGASQEESAGKTDELIRMGADLAATFGGSVSDAVSAVGSLLRGERDPIERYGVAIKDADIKAQLAATGQDKLTGAARKSAEAQATLTLLTKATANAHGAFGRESNTLAGQQERLRAQFENVKATVGAGLTPVLTTLLTWVTGRLLPGAQQLAGTLRDRLAPAFTAVGAFVTGQVMPAFRALAGQASGPSTTSLGGLAGFITGTVVPTAQRMATYFTGSVVPAFRQLAAFVGANVVPVLRALATFIVATVIPAVIRLGTPVLGGFRTALATVGAAVDKHRAQLTTLGNAVLAAGRVIGPLASIVGTVLGGAFRVAGAAVSGWIAILAGVVGTAERAAAAVRRLVEVARTVGGALGKLNPFGAALTVGSPQLVGPGGGGLLGPGRLASAAMSPGAYQLLSRTATGGIGVTVVDQRRIDARVIVNGALDAPATARQIEQLMRDQAVRLGRATAFA